MTKVLTVVLCLLVLSASAQDGLVKLVLTSDVHYGIYRHHFRNGDSVASTSVNQAMIQSINELPNRNTPPDSGIGANLAIRHIDGLLITGDITNRQEKGIQSSAASWTEFTQDYSRLTTQTADKQKTPLWIVAGNHDVSDAIGYYKPMVPLMDASSMAGIYNLMTGRQVFTKENFNYTRDKPHYSRDIAGIHLLFVNLWPDSAEQAWIEKDLQYIPKGEPALLFMHSPPDVDARFFTNPNGSHSINDSDRFENLLPERFLDGKTASTPSLLEQRALVAFLKKHPCIKAIFHGHENFNEYYDWQGPDHDISIPCFRVDSPIKGKLSSKDENRLSFQLLTIDTNRMALTVRECLWNVHNPDGNIQFVWGTQRTISLK